MSKKKIDWSTNEVIINPDDLTIGEMRKIQDASGEPIGALGQDMTKLSVDMLAALVWVSMRRVDPEATLEQAEDIRSSQMVWGDSDEDPDEDPTDGDDD